MVIYRSDGTYVSDYYRTKPDGIESSNLSYKNKGSGTDAYSDTFDYDCINDNYSSETISNIQAVLKEDGFYSGVIDGIFGLNT